MWFRLAVLWRCEVEEAKARCDSYQFGRWRAFYSIEPWGSEADDVRTAMVCFLIACAHAGKGQHPKFEDFLPNWSGLARPKGQTWQQQRAILRSYLGRFPGDGGPEGDCGGEHRRSADPAGPQLPGP
jgi:hypothetical protein